MGEWESACLQHGIHCWLFADGGGVNGKDDPDSLEKPVAPGLLASAPLSEHGSC